MSHKSGILKREGDYPVKRTKVRYWCGDEHDDYFNYDINDVTVILPFGENNGRSQYGTWENLESLIFTILMTAL